MLPAVLLFTLSFVFHGNQHKAERTDTDVMSPSERYASAYIPHVDQKMEKYSQILQFKHRLREQKFLLSLLRLSLSYVF